MGSNTCPVWPLTLRMLKMADGSGVEDASGGDFHGPWGCLQFFIDLSDFVVSHERQYGIANQPFAECAADRLAVSVQNVSHLCSVVDKAETSELARVMDGLLPPVKCNFVLATEPVAEL